MKFKFLLFSIGLGTLAIILNTHCTKITPTDIGTELLPAVDNVQTFETSLRVYADNYLMNDSSRINYSEDHALGIIEDDPEFGKTEGQIYFSVVPTSTDSYPFTNVDSIVGMDSVILSLAYKGIYGDSTSVQKINVYEISDAAFQDSIGYLVSHPEFSTTGTVLGGKTVDFTTIDDPKTIIIKSDTQVVSNVLKIPLDPALGMRFAAYDTSIYRPAMRDSAFQTVFNGLALKTDEAGSPQKNALAYYNLYDENTKLTCYFRIKKAGGVDTVAADFQLYITGLYTAYNANLVKRTAMHGYAGLSVNTAIPDAGEIYLQSSPGSYAILKIPGLDTMQNAIIHRAEIAFEPLDPPGNTIYTSPDFLFLDLVDSANNRYLTVRDDFIYSFAPNYTYNYQIFGGYLDDDKYFINLTRYVQNLVTTHSKNYPLRLYAPKTAYAYYSYPKETGSLISSGRVAYPINKQIAKGRAYVGGGTNTAKPMRLRIIYSKI
ncbi:MAG TPA: DUF4270 family protein [Agriterribacter sp.]|nr:DUF4270 family protein [Agriterribacter sp.]